MPACTTPELCPVWWTATRLSFSTTTTRAPGRRLVSSRPIARPTMPAPMIPIVSSLILGTLVAAGDAAGSRLRGIGCAETERLVHLAQQVVGGERLLQQRELLVEHPGR